MFIGRKMFVFVELFVGLHHEVYVAKTNIEVDQILLNFKKHNKHIKSKNNHQTKANKQKKSKPKNKSHPMSSQVITNVFFSQNV